MKYIFNKDGTLNCLSDSGSNYTITPTSCDCKGFQFRRKCKHFSKAIEKGFIEKLQNQMTRQLPSFRKSPYIIESRKKAITNYLEKSGIVPKIQLVDALEKIVTRNMTPGYFLIKARQLNKKL